MHRWNVASLLHQLLATDRARIRTAFFEAPFAKAENAFARMSDAVLRPLRTFFFDYFRRILLEGGTAILRNSACAASQLNEFTI
jgi:hypothetical protein